MIYREATPVALAATALAIWLGSGSLSATGPPLFLLGVLLFIYLPGALTLELFDWPRPRSIALTLASGLPSGLLLWWIASRLLPAHVYLASTAIAFALVAVRRAEWLRPSPPRWSLSSIATAVVVGLLVFGSLSKTSYRSIELRADGGLGYTHSVDLENVKIGGSDAFFHAGVTSAITRSGGRSMNPYVVGAPLAYHAGMDLLSSAFARELGIPPIDLAARFLPTLFVLVLSALVYQLARALGLTSFYSLLAVVLTFASDSRLLFYILPVRAEWESRYWLSYFTAYPATTFYWTNPLLPALVMLVAGVLVFLTGRSSLRTRCFAGALLGATALFKVFLALHVAAVLVVLFLVRYVHSRRTDLVPVVGVAGVIMVVTAIGNSLYGESEVAFRLTFLGPVRSAFQGAGLEPLADVFDAVRNDPDLFNMLQAILCFLLYLVMLLGVRVVAMPSSLKAAFQGSDEPARAFIALFFILGLVPALVVSIRVSGLNNSFWFTNQSLFMGAVLVATTLQAVGRAQVRRIGVVLTLVIGLLPTWRDVSFRGRQPQAVWSAAELEAARALRELSNERAVVLHPVNREAPSPASHIAGRASVLTYWQGYPFSFAPAEEVERRAADIATFFRTDDPAEARAVLAKYGVSWVYVPKERPLRAPVAGILKEMYSNDEITLYLSSEVSTAERN